MRTITVEQTRMLGAQVRRTVFKIEIAPTTGGSYVDVTAFPTGFGNTLNFFKHLTYKDSVDDPSSTWDIVLANKIFDYATVPMMTKSYVNQSSTLVGLNYSVRVSVATVQPNVIPVPADYNVVLLGRVYKINWGLNDEFTLNCHDYCGELMSLWTYGTAAIKIYGSNAAPTAIETVMQAVITDVQTGTGGVQPYLATLYTPTASGASTRAMTASLGNQPLYTVLQNYAQQRGWLLKQKWDSGTSAFRLTFYDPLRTNTTSTWTWAASQYYDVTQIGLDLAEIRNTVLVSWVDVNGSPNSLAVTDATSASIYGAQFLALAGEATQGLYTGTDATNLGNAAISDLSQPQVVVSLKVPYFWPIEVTDVYTISANGEHFDTDQKLAVVSYEHDCPADGPCTTTINFRGKPSGGIVTYFMKQATFVQKKFGTYNSTTDTVYRYPNSTFSQNTRF